MFNREEEYRAGLGHGVGLAAGFLIVAVLAALCASWTLRAWQADSWTWPGKDAAVERR